MSKETAILFLCFWILVCMAVAEIRDQEARAEVKEALERKGDKAMNIRFRLDEEPKER